MFRCSALIHHLARALITRQCPVKRPSFFPSLLSSLRPSHPVPAYRFMSEYSLHIRMLDTCMYAKLCYNVGKQYLEGSESLISLVPTEYGGEPTLDCRCGNGGRLISVGPITYYCGCATPSPHVHYNLMTGRQYRTIVVGRCDIAVCVGTNELD
jgi:hypothetical protein